MAAMDHVCLSRNPGPPSDIQDPGPHDPGSRARHPGSGLWGPGTRAPGFRICFWRALLGIATPKSHCLPKGCLHCARVCRKSNVIIANEIIVTATPMANWAFRATGQPFSQGKVINRDYRQCDYRQCHNRHCSGGYCILPVVHQVSHCPKGRCSTLDNEWYTTRENTTSCKHPATGGITPSLIQMIIVSASKDRKVPVLHTND